MFLKGRSQKSTFICLHPELLGCFLNFSPPLSLDPNNTPPQTTATGGLFPGLIIINLQQHANCEVKRSCSYALMGLFQSTLLVSVFFSQCFCCYNCCEKQKLALLCGTLTATTPLPGMFIPGHVTPGNNRCNLHNTKASGVEVCMLLKCAVSYKT